eukprot:GHRR01013996.1.p1 GENE.GHRR01013996.1~~GHRR01013996.1.p1  ORF type:complete len:724 (+),score=209.94 GHRR01013996.1:247-2418(+)
MPLLHGVLQVVVYEAQNLPTTRRIQAVGCIKRYVCCGALPQLAGSCDPYLCLDVGNTRRVRSRFIQGTHNPVWNERHEVYVADEADQLKIEIKDADIIGADFLGQAIIPVSEVVNGEQWDKWLDLTDTNGNPMKGKHVSGDRQQSRAHISIRYEPVGTKDETGEKYKEVPRAYFPLRPGNKVTLYHDAVCTPGPVEGAKLRGGGLYSDSCCWDDIYKALQQAKRFIWITGWSVWAPTMLKRRPMAQEDAPPLGELLIKKAREGVSVLLLVWDDATNNTGLTEGVMGTHDQETYRFFKHTEVTCVLCPRQGGMEDSLLQKVARGSMFTHHQKTVIVDTPMDTPVPIPLQQRARSGSSNLDSKLSAALHTAKSGLLAAKSSLAPTRSGSTNLDKQQQPAVRSSSPFTAAASSNQDKHQHKASRFSALETDSTGAPGSDKQQHKVGRHSGSPTARSGSTNLDRQHPMATRRLVAFVGGIDLTDGRYDTPAHPLFGTDQTGGPHERDHYQSCLESTDMNKPCPRQPWHDIHARLEGPAAIDIAMNFMERWVKQAGKHHLYKLGYLNQYGDILMPEALQVFASKRRQLQGRLKGHIDMRIEAIKAHYQTLELQDVPEPETWSVQVFRTIDSDSAYGFPNSTEGCYEAGLGVGKGKSVDRSIHRAYVHLIRIANRFLYLENQYFLGSAHLWDRLVNPSACTLCCPCSLRASPPVAACRQSCTSRPKHER